MEFFPPASPAGARPPGLKSLRSGGAPAPHEQPLCTGLSAGDRINHYKPINYFPPASRPATNSLKTHYHFDVCIIVATRERYDDDDDDDDDDNDDDDDDHDDDDDDD